MLKLTSSLLLVLAIAFAAGYLLLKRRSNISGAEARRLVQAGARLIDVRSPAEYMAGHIPGAVNIPVQDLEHRLLELEGTQRPIVVYCRSGNRSGSAARILKRGGYSEVHDLGAIHRW